MNQDPIPQLIEKLRFLMQRHQEFSKEIQDLRAEIYALRDAQSAGIQTKPIANTPLEEPITQVQASVAKPKFVLQQAQASQIKGTPKTKIDFEKFLGENLINKIGILITIIGVVIGAKYSIENNLISPLTRIVLGYVLAAGVLGFGLKLKEKYEKFSAVLVSGAMCMLYFLTFAAYDFYNLIPQLLAFGLMTLFTAFTVLAAINYKRQIIAHLGLVGSYAVPFLLSNNSGNIMALFAFMLVINIGILAISLKQYWKSLYYSSFGFTWLIYLGWLLYSYKVELHFGTAFLFLCLFFLVFYATFLAYKVLKKEQFNTGDVILLLANSFVFFGSGIYLLNNSAYSHLMGAFTVANGVVHALIAGTLFRLKLVDKKLLYLIAGLVMVFVTTAVPIQFNGSWVTLIWIAQALVLFGIGRYKNVALYEKMTYPILLLAIISLVDDWSLAAPTYYQHAKIAFKPFLNIGYLCSLFFFVALGGIVWLQQKKETSLEDGALKLFIAKFYFILPSVLIVLLYIANFQQLSILFDVKFHNSMLSLKDPDGFTNIYYDYDVQNYRTLWLINYTIVFVVALSIINLKKIENQTFAFVGMGLNLLVAFVFLLLGLYALSELRASYLTQDLASYYTRSEMNLWIRYVSYFFLAVLVICTYFYQKFYLNHKALKKLVPVVFHTIIIWVLSSELLHWLDFAGVKNVYKLGLSILWGCYSLFLIAFGIWKKNQVLRIGAMILFGLTLVKLFFYDIVHLNTISKTIVFVSLGVLLLIISFLYNKYKNNISGEETE
jgi:hypothetical protein